MIDDEDKAHRLAKAICADVMLSNAAVKDAPVNERAGLISEPISEGRALFASRVSPRLAGIFEAEVAASVAVPLGVTASSLSTSTRAAQAQQQSVLAAPVLPQSNGGNGLLIAVVVLIVVAAAGFFFFSR